MTASHLTTSGVYQIRCLVNGKVYVGSAINIKKRWNEHRRDLKLGKHHSVHLQRAWTKHGPSQFKFEILGIVALKEDLIRAEQDWIDRIRSFKRDIGYNISPTAGSCLGAKQTKIRSAETRAKLSAALKGKNKRPRSAEERAHLSAMTKGRPKSPETRARMTAANKARTGHKHTPDARDRISQAARKRTPRSAKFMAMMRAMKKPKPQKDQKTFEWSD